MIECADKKKYVKKYACSGMLDQCKHFCEECDKELAFRCGNGLCIPRNKVSRSSLTIPCFLQIIIYLLIIIYFNNIFIIILFYFIQFINIYLIYLIVYQYLSIYKYIFKKKTAYNLLTIGFIEIIHKYATHLKPSLIN